MMSQKTSKDLQKVKESWVYTAQWYNANTEKEIVSQIADQTFNKGPVRDSYPSHSMGRCWKSTSLFVNDAFIYVMHMYVMHMYVGVPRGRRRTAWGSHYVGPRNQTHVIKTWRQAPSLLSPGSELDT